MQKSKSNKNQGQSAVHPPSPALLWLQVVLIISRRRQIDADKANLFCCKSFCCFPVE